MHSHFANIKTLNLANINKIQHKCSHHGDNLAEDCQHSHNRIHTKIILNFDKAGFEKKYLCKAWIFSSIVYYWSKDCNENVDNGDTNQLWNRSGDKLKLKSRIGSYHMIKNSD